MSPSTMIRKFVSVRPSRSVSTTSTERTSTSPQRRQILAPCHKIRADPKPFGDIPGPLALPMLRHSAHVLPRIGSFHHVVGLGLLEGLHNKYGDLVRLAKGYRSRPVLYVFHPEIMREVYDSHGTESPSWDKSPLSAHRTKNAECPIKSSETKAIWAALRSLLQDQAILATYDAALNEIASDFTRRLEDLRHVENALNEELETEVYRWALEVLGLVVFGSRLGCLDGATHVPNDDDRTPKKCLEDEAYPCSLTKKCLTTLTPAERLVRSSREIADENYLVRTEATLKSDSEGFNLALKAFDNHMSLIKHFLELSLAELEAGSPRPELSLLERLKPLNQRLLPVVTDMLLAGVDPLVQSTLSMFHHLSLNAAQQQRAHDQVCWSNASKELGEFSVELPYVAACAREALRLYPATGGVVRRSKEDMLVDGYQVPSGVDIVLAHGVTSKLPKQWVRSTAFLPERWCSEGWQPLRASKAHPAASMPFGDSCPGEGIVAKTMASLATRVLERFRLEWHGPSPKIVTTGVNKLQPPFYFVLKDAH